MRRLVAVWVRPSVLPDDVRERRRGSRPIVFALEKRSIVDLAVLEYVCRERSLPRPLGPLGSGTLLRRSVFFLERRIGFFGLRMDRRMPDALRILSGAAAADVAFEADIVPVSLFWGRAPGRERAWFRLMVAEDWDIGGRFRKFLSLLINGRNLLVLFGEVLPCSRRCAETRGMPRGPRRMWRQLRIQFRNQRIATIGPDLSHRRTIVAQVLRTHAVREAVRDDMQEKELTRREALKVARAYAYEIAANYSHPFVVFMSGDARPPVEPAVRRRRAREFLEPAVGGRGQRNRLRALPSQPHGLPADVLRRLPQGLRRAAHRRRHQSQHAGDRLVPAPGRRVLPAPQFRRQRDVLRRVHEVPRADDGARPLDRVLHRGRAQPHRPAAAAEDRHARDDRAQLPARAGRGPWCSCRCTSATSGSSKARTYIGELSGRPKEKESILGMLRTLPELRSRFGKVYVSFGEPLPLDAGDPQASSRVESRRSPSRRTRPPWLAPLATDLAQQIMTRINAAACVTPINLLGTGAAGDAAPEHGRGRPGAAARAVCVAAAAGAVFAARLGHAAWTASR